MYHRAFFLVSSYSELYLLRAFNLSAASECLIFNFTVTKCIISLRITSQTGFTCSKKTREENKITEIVNTKASKQMIPGESSQCVATYLRLCIKIYTKKERDDLSQKVQGPWICTVVLDFFLSTCEHAYSRSASRENILTLRAVSFLRVYCSIVKGILAARVHSAARRHPFG